MTEINKEIVSEEYFLQKGAEKDKKIADLKAKKLSLIKEVMVEEIKQNNDGLTEDEISELEEQIDQKVESKSTGQGSDGDKGNSGKGNSGKDNNSSKEKGSDKGNKGGKGKSKK